MVSSFSYIMIIIYVSIRVASYREEEQEEAEVGKS